MIWIKTLHIYAGVCSIYCENKLFLAFVREKREENFESNFQEVFP